MTTARVIFTRKTSNEKTGPIPVTMTSRATCPDSCGLKGTDSEGKLNGCYAEGWPLNGHWTDMETSAKSITWAELCEAIAALPPGQKWRAHQAGDMPCDPSVPSDMLDATAVSDLATANAGRTGFTYTHYPTNATALARARLARLEKGLTVDHLTLDLVRHNRAVIADANLRGLTINVSHDTTSELDSGVADVLPSVVVIPLLEKGEREPKVTFSPAGRKIVVCPAQWRDTSCSECTMCQNSGRDYIVGFRAHGIARRVVSNMVSAGKLNKAKRPAEVGTNLSG